MALQSSKNPQKTRNGAQFTNVSKNVEMRPNQILRQQTPKLSVQTTKSPSLSPQQVTAIKKSPAGVLPKFLNAISPMPKPQGLRRK